MQVRDGFCSQFLFALIPYNRLPGARSPPVRQDKSKSCLPYSRHVAPFYGTAIKRLAGLGGGASLPRRETQVPVTSHCVVPRRRPLPRLWVVPGTSSFWLTVRSFAKTRGAPALELGPSSLPPRCWDFIEGVICFLFCSSPSASLLLGTTCFSRFCHCSWRQAHKPFPPPWRLTCPCSAHHLFLPTTSSSPRGETQTPLASSSAGLDTRFESGRAKQRHAQQQHDTRAHGRACLQHPKPID